MIFFKIIIKKFFGKNIFLYLRQIYYFETNNYILSNMGNGITKDTDQLKNLNCKSSRVLTMCSHREGVAEAVQKLQQN